MINFGFVMEQVLGHVTHHQNLARWTAEASDIRPTWMPIRETQSDLWERLPVVRGNWSLKSSLRARDALKTAERNVKFDALLLHTQTTSLFAIPAMRRIPTIVSLDATPYNYDSVGEQYGHVPAKAGWLERRKCEWNCKTFKAATHLITWCHWAKNSLVADYAVPNEKITVIPPGVDLEQWKFDRVRTEPASKPNEKLRLLFVGGDFSRKGGNLLAAAFRKGLQSACELDIVTREAQAEQVCGDLEGARVHRGLTANSAALKDLYRRADLFVFPTLADCLPIAVMEAMAAGLPVITTDVGALREEVEDGVNGRIIPPNDADAIIEAVCALKEDYSGRQSMSRAGRRIAEERFDARANYNAVLDIMRRIAR